uniref:hypothetical protein n=1 Tax=Ferroglobus placidus TaxID=54261 RepID=UPI0001B769C3|nr:hypothetical protein [Ferroglobus placidus]
MKRGLKGGISASKTISGSKRISMKRGLKVELLWVSLLLKKFLLDEKRIENSSKVRSVVRKIDGKQTSNFNKKELKNE